MFTRRRDWVRNRLATILSLAVAVNVVADAQQQESPRVKPYPMGTVTFAGACPRISPNGRFVAIRRHVREEEPLIRGGPRDPKYIPIRNDLWILDLKSQEEFLLREDCPQHNWLADDAIAVSPSEVLDPRTGVQLSEGPRPARVTANGTALTYSTGRSDPIECSLNHPIVSDILSSEKGPIWISPRGTHVAFDLLFARSGAVPLRRIGIANLQSKQVLFVGESAYCHYNWGYQAQQRFRCDTDPWSRDGSYFAFVSGRGDGETDIFLATSDGEHVFRLTNDGECKWSPVFDSTGRRLAYFAAGWGGEDGTLRDVHIRILDIYTGEEQRMAPENDPGWGLVLAWSPDGSELYHDWNRGDSPRYRDLNARIFRINFPQSQPVPEGSTIRSVPAVSLEDQVIKALNSGISTRLNWGTIQSYQVPTDRVRQALCQALPVWMPRDYPCAGDIVVALKSMDARESASVIGQAILLPPEPFGIPAILPPEERKEYWEPYRTDALCESIATLLEWNLQGSAAHLREYLARFPDSEPAVYATGALAACGEPERWQQLTDYARNSNKEIRWRLAEILGLVRDPRSVDLLIDLIGDDEVVSMSTGDETQVGDLAAKSLTQLTGQTFGRAPAEWRNWWAHQNGILPDPFPSDLP